jgi:hypothetical protein
MCKIGCAEEFKMKTKYRFFFVVAVFLSPWLLPAHSSFAQAVYHWVDAQGGTHFTDNPDAIPPQYRQGAASEDERLTATTPSSAESTPGNDSAKEEAGTKEKEEADTKKEPPSPYEAALQSAGASVDNFGHDESYWRDRKKFWEKRLEESQRLYDEARRQFNLSLQRHYSANQYKRMKDARQDMARLQAEVDKARQTLAGLPEEARKAGAPPGWVR